MKTRTLRTWSVVTFLFAIVINVHGTTNNVPVKQENVLQNMPFETLRTEIIDLINKHDESRKPFTRDSFKDLIPELPLFQDTPELAPKPLGVLLKPLVPIPEPPAPFLLSDLKAGASLLKGGLVVPTEIPAEDFGPQKIPARHNKSKQKNEIFQLPLVNSLMQTLGKIRHNNSTRSGIIKSLSVPLNTTLLKKFNIEGAKCTSERCKSQTNKASKPQCGGKNWNPKKKETGPQKQNLGQILLSLGLNTKHTQVSCEGFDPRMALTNTFPRRNPLPINTKTSKPQCGGKNWNPKKKETGPQKQNLGQILLSLGLNTKHTQVSCEGFDPRMALTNTFPRRNPLLIKTITYGKNFINPLKGKERHEK